MAKKPVKWNKNKDAKTQICVMCEIRKPMEHFYIKKPPYILKKAKESFTNGRYRRCKECHNAWNRKLYLKRTTKEERRVYMLKYMRAYNNIQTYRRAA